MGSLTNELAEVPVYEPTAIYYEDADSLEYVRLDKPTVYRRVDEFLTLILDMSSREPVGFKLKGFRYIYNSHVRHDDRLDKEDFPRVVKILEDIMTSLGNRIFEDDNARLAYQTALNIAEEDKVKLSELPQVA